MPVQETNAQVPPPVLTTPVQGTIGQVLPPVLAAPVQGTTAEVQKTAPPKTTAPGQETAVVQMIASPGALRVQSEASTSLPLALPSVLSNTPLLQDTRKTVTVSE